jgi:hypothetical protein
MEDFNTKYTELVSTFIKRYTNLTITKPDGSVWNLYVYDNDEAFCITQAPEYCIPPEIQELINTKCVVKSHAHLIEFTIDTFLCWNNIGIDTCCGISWRGNLTCNVCGVRATDNYFGKWNYADMGTLCGTCYDLNPQYKNRGFQYIDITAFNVLDWVIFIKNDIISESVTYTFYVNCNTQSHYYGQIMLGIDDEDNFGAQFHIIGDVHEFIMYITDWLNTTGTLVMQIHDCLNEPIHICSVYDVSYNYGIVKKGETLTIQDVLSNINATINGSTLIPKLVMEYRKLRDRGERGYDGDLSDEDIDKLAEKYTAKVHGKPIFDQYNIEVVYGYINSLTMYNEPKASRFPIWLCEKLNI